MWGWPRAQPVLPLPLKCKCTDHVLGECLFPPHHGPNGRWSRAGCVGAAGKRQYQREDHEAGMSAAALWPASQDCMPPRPLAAFGLGLCPPGSSAGVCGLQLQHRHRIRRCGRCHGHCSFRRCSCSCLRPRSWRRPWHGCCCGRWRILCSYPRCRCSACACGLPAPACHALDGLKAAPVHLRGAVRADRGHVRRHAVPCTAGGAAQAVAGRRRMGRGTQVQACL